MGRASSSRDSDFEEDVNDFETRPFRKADARRGWDLVGWKIVTAAK